MDVWWNIYREWNNIFDKISLVKKISLTNTRFSTSRTLFSLSITLLYVISVWKRLFNFSFWIIPLDESINLNSLKSHFTRSYHTRWMLKNDGSDRFWFKCDKPSKVKNSHVTEFFSVWFCWMSGFFFCFLSENKFLCF